MTNMTRLETKIAALHYALEQDEIMIDCWQDPQDALLFLQTVQQDFTAIQAENARLRQENEELESLLTETVKTLTQAVEQLAQAQFEIVQRAV